MGTPQIITLILFSADLLATAHLHGREQGPWNFWTALVGNSIMVAILWWGGFFGR